MAETELSPLSNEMPWSDPDVSARVVATASRRPVGAFLLDMTQELRAPMNAIIGMSGLLLDNDLEAKQRQYAKGVYSAAEALSAVLNDILDLARIGGDRLPIEPIPFDLRSMVEETARALSGRAEERRLALRVDWRPDVPRHVVGDPGRVRQVLGNLIGYALHNTTLGEVVIHLAPSAALDGSARIRFTVQDTGVGIPAERLPHVFDEYAPVDASPYRSFCVTGLGLRLSAELVRLMGGEMGAESAVGRGSRFWFTLPLVPADLTSDLASGDSEARRPARVLIVEADPAARKRFTAQVELAESRVDFADDLIQVADRLRAAQDEQDPFTACLLSDYAVRRVHEDLAQQLKQDSALASIALIMATAVGSPGDGKRLWHAGFAAYLRKPVQQDELRETLVAVERVGFDGRTGTLITRHSLAEAKSAQSVEFDGIDALLNRIILNVETAAKESPAEPANDDWVTPRVELKEANGEAGETAEIAPPALETSAAVEPSIVETAVAESEPAPAFDQENVAETVVELTGGTADITSTIDSVPTSESDAEAELPRSTRMAAIYGEWDETTDSSEEIGPLAGLTIVDDFTAPSATTAAVEPVPAVKPMNPPIFAAAPAWLPRILQPLLGRGEGFEPVALLVAGAPRIAPTEIESGVSVEEPISVSIESSGKVDPGSDLPPLPIIGSDIVEQLRSGPAPLVQHLVGTFLKEAPTRIGELATLMNRGDYGRARQVLASLKGIAGLLAASRLIALVDGMEKDLADGIVDRASGQLGNLEAAFLEVRLTVDPIERPASPAIDPSFLDQLRAGRVAGTETLAVRLAGTFSAEAPGRMADLRRAADERDPTAVTRQAQNLKNLCGLIGAHPLAALVAQIDSDARAELCDDVRAALVPLAAELDRVTDALGSALRARS